MDAIPARLEKAGEIGAIPFDFRAGDPGEQIMAQGARKRKGGRATWRGEEAVNGVAGGIDAIGIPARDWNGPSCENPVLVIHALARLVNPTGRLAITGVFLPNDAQPNSELEAHGDITVSWHELFRKDVTIGIGRDHDVRYNAQLRDVIIAGRAKPGVIVSHRLPLTEAPEAHRRFDHRDDAYVKIVLDPAKA